MVAEIGGVSNTCIGGSGVTLSYLDSNILIKKIRQAPDKKFNILFLNTHASKAFFMSIRDKLIQTLRKSF